MKISDRISKFVKHEGIIGENMALGSKRAEDVLLQMVIDDGDKLRTQRMNVF